jgi:hypothetical protein
MSELAPRPAWVGVVGGAPASVAPDGTVAVDGAGWSLSWWIGADDRWRVPARETAVRRTYPGGVPVVETAMRVPSGDARHRVYGAAPGAFVVEVQNDSAAPFVVTFVVRGARAVDLDGPVVWVDGVPALVAPRAPSRWAVATGTGGSDATYADVAEGRASGEPFPGARDRRGRAEVALLHPVAHRTTLRTALLTPDAPAGVDPLRLPGADTVTRGWSAQLDRGMRVELPDEVLVAAVRRARAELLLASGRHEAPAAEDVVALEDWGFDAEAAAAWERLPGRARRRASRRSSDPAGGADVERARAAGDGPALLLALRRLLVHEGADGTVTICAELPRAWRGGPLEVHDAPTRRGPVSYAVRWHGSRPALLWDVPEGVLLRAPGLDPAWSTAEPRGDALLAPGGVPA